MKPWTKWLSRLGIAGACVIAVGCGGSDVPDTSSDGQTVADSAQRPESAPAQPATPVAQGRPIAGRPGAPKADAAPAEETTAAPAAEAEKTATPSKTQGGSATAEMLAAATNSNSGGNSQPAPGTTPPATPGASPSGVPGGMPAGMAAMMQGQGRPGMGPGGPSPGGPGGPAGGAAAQMRPGPMASGGPSPGDMAGMMANNMKMQQQQRGAGGPGAPGGAGMPGGPGGPGGQGRSPAADKPANFRTPEGAVEAFLNALVAKDADRLAEACALRASVEPPEKNKALFKKIYGLELSDSELDDLSKSLEGYRIVGENPAKSTARVEVVLQKSSDNGSFHRLVVTVRREGKDRKWGVLHLAKPTEFKPLTQQPRRR
jgi:hypothetical protein